MDSPTLHDKLSHYYAKNRVNNNMLFVASSKTRVKQVCSSGTGPGEQSRSFTRIADGERIIIHLVDVGKTQVVSNSRGGDHSQYWSQTFVSGTRDLQPPFALEPLLCNPTKR